MLQSSVTKDNQRIREKHPRIYDLVLNKPQEENAETSKLY